MFRHLIIQPDFKSRFLCIPCKNISKSLLCLIAKRILSAISCGGGARSIIISELDQFAESPKPHTSDYLILPQKEIESENIICFKDIEGSKIKS